MNVAGFVIALIFLLLLLAAIGWVVFTRRRASQLGLPPPPLSSYIPFRKSSAPEYGPPQPAPGGIQGWFNDRIRMFKNRNSRTAAGAYEQTSGGSSAPRARGFDPDEAWDSRVGHEDGYGPGAYYEEQELGLHPQHGDTSYSGANYAMNLAATPGHAPEGFGSTADDEARGRPRSRSPGLAPSGAASGSRNPFDDDAEPSNISLRGVSPRPIDTQAAKAQGTGQKDPGSGDSPSERRSIFRENV